MRLRALAALTVAVAFAVAVSMAMIPDPQAETVETGHGAWTMDDHVPSIDLEPDAKAKPLAAGPTTTTTVTVPPTTVTVPPTTAPAPPAPPTSLPAPPPPPPVNSTGQVNGYPCGGDLPPCWVLERESGGNPTAENPTSSASGLWQFIDSTWAGFGGYSHASHAPVAVQNEKARQLWAGGAGCSHWSACG